LSATCDIAGASALQAELLEKLAAGTPTVLDASFVAEPSTALIQLVESAAAAFAARELRFGLYNPSDALCIAYEEMGLYGALMGRIAMEI
jgi:anti-anti-sigma regulatory factor